MTVPSPSPIFSLLMKEAAAQYATVQQLDDYTAMVDMARMRTELLRLHYIRAQEYAEAIKEREGK